MLHRSPDPNVAEIASLIGDPVRATMLFTLFDGLEHSASELAFRASASRQAASAHLAKLVQGGLIKATASGRRRLFRIASEQVGHAMEALAAAAKPEPIVSLSQSTSFARLREARTCYDHLAGRLGVAVTDACLNRSFLEVNGKTFELTPRGDAFFSGIGVDVANARENRRAFAQACPDWTEHRAHLGGSLGAALFARFLSASWIERIEGGRAVRSTERGRSGLSHAFGICFDDRGALAS